MGNIFKIGTMQAQVLYARCKMSIANETGNSDAYKRLKFVEFLGLICRVTHHIFKVNTSLKLPFDKQLEYIIDQILWKVGLHRNCPRIHWQDADYESDDEDD